MPTDEVWLGERASASPTVRRIERQEAEARRQAATLTRAQLASNRASGRDYAQRLEADIGQQARELIERRAALHESIGYRYRHWAGRSDSTYDRAAWRRGRLVPKAVRTAEDRRNAVSWVEILDREAQEQGTTPDQLMQEAERARRENERLRAATLEHRNTTLSVRAFLRELRQGDERAVRHAALVFEQHPDTPEVEEFDEVV